MKKPWSLKDLKKRKPTHTHTVHVDPTMCGNIWKLAGECKGSVHPYIAARRDSQEFYDPETLEPFERSKFSIKNAQEIRSKTDTRQAIITYLCDHHRKLMDEIHPELVLGLVERGMPDGGQPQ